MSPRTIPNSSSRTLAIGARQFVVHEALEIMLWFVGSYLSWLTPITIVTSSSVAGAEMITFFAPPAMCFFASAALVKKPVDSITISAFTSLQGRLAGSFSAKIRIVLPFTVIELSVCVTVASKRPSIESYFKRWASVFTSVRSLMPTTSIFAFCVNAALKKLRPIRPNPLIPTRTTVNPHSEKLINKIKQPQRCSGPNSIRLPIGKLNVS